MSGKTLSEAFRLADLDTGDSEIIEILHRGKLRKFEVLSREWNDEKVGH